MLQDDLYTNAWEAEFDRHPFDISIIYTDPNPIDFDDSQTQGPDTVIVPHSCFHDSHDGQSQETCATFDPPTVHPPDPKLNGQSQDIETTTDLTYIDNSKRTPEPSTDTEITYEPMPQLPLKQSDNPAAPDINDPTIEIIPQSEPSHSRGARYNLRPNPNPNYSEIYRY